ncbi:cyclin-T1-4 [Amaranthus tricolor]|uniref:cyclin-T1-4 n=1 Tax=Amaranthus tricolor TaxID=29722 RepID=UPI002582C4E3|nr:cyclin-T1-4 [Amaranthus tricolor]
MTGSSQNSSDAFREDIPANQIGTRGWYFTKEEIDNHSPSRKDGIDRATESSLRRSYCSFLQDLSKMLRVNTLTTATAMMFCHRFYMRQSHTKNDWQTVATACMFLATKAEDCFRPLRDVTLVAYVLIHKWDPSAAERIKQQKIYDKQKELILAAENLLLVTIAFDFSIQHPYIPLVNALKLLQITNNVVAMAAWNLLNEWYKTTLCLQYKPHYIAAASLSIPAILLNFKLPRVEGKPWWLSFDVSPVKLQEVILQMLLYFKPNGNVNVTPVDINAMNPSKIENATSQSSPISILVGLEPREDSAPVASQEQKSNSCKYVQKGTRAISDKVMLKAASGHDENQKPTGMPQ